MIDVELDDLIESATQGEKLSATHTVAFSPSQKQIIKEASRLLGGKEAAEVIRRCAIAGLVQMIEMKKKKAG